MSDTGCLTLDPTVLACVAPETIGSFNICGLGMQTVGNPCQGTGNTVIYYATAPGPGLGGGVWQDPPGATVLETYEIPSTDPNQFVQRVRIWYGPEPGTSTVQFGFNGVAGNDHSASMICLSQPGVTVTSSGPIIGNAISATYPSISVPNGSSGLVFALTSAQVADFVTAGPAGYTTTFNQGNICANRSMAVHYTDMAGTTTTPPPSTYSGTQGAHIRYTLAAYCTDAVARTCNPVPANDWTVFFDPEDPATFGPTRTDCQLIAAGNVLNTGQTTNTVSGCGYGLGFDANNQIHSFPMEDGDTFRFGPKTAAGLCDTTTALCHKHQWLNDGSYDESQEQPNGQNFSTTCPDIDRTFFDGTRTQLACIPTSQSDPKAVIVGPGCDTVRVATTWRIEEWMLAADGNAALHNLHEPGAGAPSPLSTYLGDNGKLTIITRDTSTPFTAGTTVPATTRAQIPITATDVGEWWSIIYEYCIDPANGYLNVWLDQGTGVFNQIVNVTGGVGYAFSPTAVNGNGEPYNNLFYGVLVNYYSWHRFTNDPVNAPNNWDDTYGNVRELCYAYAGLTVNGAVTPEQMMEHALTYTCGDCT